MRVETVRGAMAVDRLGTTLMREHVFVLTPDLMQNYGHEWWDEQDRVADAVRQLHALKDAGVDSIVDPTAVAWAATSRRCRGQRAGGHQHHRGDRAAHVRRDPAFLPLPRPGRDPGRAGADDRDVRQRHPARHRRHGGARGVLQGRGGGSRPHRGPGPRPGRDLRGASGDRVRPVRPGHVQPDRGPGAHHYRTARAGLRRPDRAQPRRVLLHGLLLRQATYSMLRQAIPNWNFLRISQDVLPALRKQGVTEGQFTAMLVDNARRYFSGAAS